MWRWKGISDQGDALQMILSHLCREGKWIHGDYEKTKQELDFCSYAYHYFNNELNILQQEK